MFYSIHIFVIILIKILYCQNYFHEPVSNYVTFYNRINTVYFTVTKNCTEKQFFNLLDQFIKFEKQARIKAKIQQQNVEWITTIYFGDTLYFSITNDSNTDLIFKCTSCYNSSHSTGSLPKLPNVDNSKNEYTVLVSDQCLTLFAKNLFNAINPTTTNMQFGFLLSSSKTEIKKCENQIMQYFNITSLPYNIHFFEHKSSEDIEAFSNMKLIYSANPSTALINLFSITSYIHNMLFDIFHCKIYSVLGNLCRNGSFVGFYQTLNIHEKNIQQQNFSKLALPLNLDHKFFIATYEKLIFEKIRQPFDNCLGVKEFLRTANSMPLNSMDEQYNILFLEDPYPECLDFNLQWNNTKRHLEIIVLYSETIKSDYSKFIIYSNLSLNHISFYDISLPSTMFCQYHSLCSLTVPFWNITEKPFLIEHSNSNRLLLFQIPFNLWILLGLILLLIFTVTLTTVYLIKKKSNDRKASVEKIYSKTLEKQKSFEFSDSYKNGINSSNQYSSSFIDNKKIVINFDKLLGKGSNAAVYEGILKSETNVTSQFSIIQNEKTKVAIKLPNAQKITAELMNEIDCLQLLKPHTNIIKFLGWSNFGEIPIIITELAYRNLLDFVQHCSKKNFDFNEILKILWQISNALAFLTKCKFIHRDVACRNILLFDKNVAKLSDFGLCCKSGKNGIFKDSTNQKFPFKWCSIEALEERKFSQKSDVWAFGILCFEVFTFGKSPYFEMMNSKEILEFLKLGKRLQKPDIVPFYIYDIMYSCWEKEPCDRPNFKEISKKLEVLLEYGYLPLKRI